jgi:hypothetical protein
MKKGSRNPYSAGLPIVGLSRGQCRACRRILRDDVRDRFCSLECSTKWAMLFSSR